jgi:hypothetical protein
MDEGLRSALGTSTSGAIRAYCGNSSSISHGSNTTCSHCIRCS